MTRTVKKNLHLSTSGEIQYSYEFQLLGESDDESSQFVAKDKICENNDYSEAADIFFKFFVRIQDGLSSCW